MNNNAYNSDMLDKIHQMYGDSSKIKKLMMQRIKDLNKNGFYLDMRNPINKDSFINILEATLKYNIKDLPSDFDISNYYQIVGQYELKNDHHDFVHVSPKDFIFEYVDFDNMRDVLNISQQTIYANSFWGIYIKNDVLKMHDLIQYDFFKKNYIIAPYNLYDGGNNILSYSDNVKTHILSICGGNHSGSIFYSWEDFIRATADFNRYVFDQYDSRVKELESSLKEIKKSKKKFLVDSKKHLDKLTQIKFS
jgi:hypothetical protein